MALSSKYTKSIEIEIGGKSTSLKKALDDANKSIRSTQSELKALQASLKLEWNADKFKRAQELAQETVKQTTAKVDALKKALAELDNKGESPDSDQYKELRKELEWVEVAAQKANKELESLNNTRLDALKESIREAGDQLDSMGSKLTVGLTAPLTAAGTAAVNYASDTEEAINKVEVAFGSAADSVKSWSESALTTYGLASGTALDMAALFGDMATSMGFADDQAAEMSKTLVGLAADLASFKNISVDQASTALKAVFTGETESLKNLGVVMTQANLQAYALAQGYKTTYTEMDQAQQVAVRYQYVLAQTQNAQGDFARTSDSTANQVRMLQESLKEAAASMGNELLPVVTPLISNLNELVQSFSDLDESTRKAVVQTGLFLAALGPAMKLTGGVASATSACISAYQSLKTAQTAATAAQIGLNAAMNANPIGAVVTAVGMLVAVLGSLALTTALTAEKTDSLTKSLKEAQAARDESTAAIRDEAAETAAMVAAVLELASVEEKTAAQKETLLGLVNQLDQAVPELNLAYDAQADSLNRTAESIQRVVEAEAQRQLRAEAIEQMVELEKERVQIVQALEEAQIRLNEAEEANKRMMEEGSWYPEITTELTEARNEFKALTSAQETNANAIDALTKQYGTLADAAKSSTQATEDNTEATQENQSAQTGLAETLSRIQSGYELLAKAQKEADETGSLSISTLQTLLEKYPELERYLVATADGYVLTEGALQDYLAAQQAEYQAVYDNVASAAQTVIDNEALQAAGYDATTMSIRDKLKAMMEMYALEATTARNAVFAQYGNDAVGQAIANSDSTVRQATSNLLAAQTALFNLDSAGSNLDTSKRVSSMLVRDYGGGTSSGTRSSGSSTGGASSAAAADPFAEARSQLDAFLEDADHRIYLWTKQGGHTEDILAEYQTMQDEIHNLAEQFRAQGLDDDSEQIQSLQKLWWGYEEDRLKLLQDADSQAQKARQAAYDEEKADLDYFHDMDIVSDEEYYRRLAALRDKYLDEDSEAWRRVTVELYNYKKKCREEELAALEDAYEQRLSALEDALDREKDLLADQYDAQKQQAKSAYEAKKSYIEAELALEEQRLNQILDGINEEIQARRELREDQDQDDAIAKARKRLEAAQAQLEFARTDEDRAEWQKEVIRLQQALDEAIQDKEDTAFYRQKEQEKEQVQADLESARDAAQQAKNQAQTDYENQLTQLEADYNARVASLEADYAARAARLREEYEESVSNAQMAAGDQTGLTGDQSGAALSGSSGGITDLAKMLAATVGTAASAVIAAQSSQTIKNASAKVIINEASSLTEGQVARTVQKVLEQLDR